MKNILIFIYLFIFFDSYGQGCYNSWVKKFETQGAEEIIDGAYIDVIITYRRGLDEDCFEGKVIVEDKKVKSCYVLMSGANGYQVAFVSKPEDNITIYDGISKTFVAKGNILINVVWQNKLKKIVEPVKYVENKPNSEKKDNLIYMTKMKGGTYKIPCKINNLPLNFIFDTGASDVSISLSEALFMFKNGYLSESDILGKAYYSIANGDIAEGTIINIKKLEFGKYELQNVKASISHSLDAPLLLGQSALSKLGKILIDYQNSTLTVIE